MRAENATITVSGSNFIGVCGDTIILRGVNYAPFSWSNDPADEKFSEIAQTGANCVRIAWYSSAAAGGGYLYDHLEYLDTAIARCVRNKLIPIVELHDLTGEQNLPVLTALSTWYLQAPVLDIISRYRQHLIINIFNEAGAAQTSQQLTDFQNAYEGIIGNLRNGGIDVPLMIDAPNYGTDLDLLSLIAPAMQSLDPLHNLIFSAHAYWYYYTNNDSTIMRNKVDNAMANNFPLVFGEVCNLQPDAVPCQLPLNYQPLLNICQQLNIGWLAWTWDHDACPGSQVSSNGFFNNLSSFGNDIVNNASFGIQSHSKLSTYLLYNQSCPTAVPENSILNSDRAFEVQSDEDRLIIHSLIPEEMELSLSDLAGRSIAKINLGGNSVMNINLTHGIYILSAIYRNTVFNIKAIK